MNKPLICLLLCVALAATPLGGLAEELDEETLAAQLAATPTPSPAATPEPPEQVYALSDVNPEGRETAIDQGERPSFVHQLLEVARGELGYAEGENNLTKYGQWAGDPHAAWCAEFICWCVDQVDQRYGTALLNAVYPNYSGQNTGRDWFIARGRFAYRKGNCPNWGYQWLRGATQLMRKNDFIPRSGDLVFFSYNEAGDTEHVALVESCAKDPSGEVILHVIEGNNPSQVQRNSYRLNNSQILGFGVCEDVIGTTMRYGNRGDKVNWLQQSLHELGLLEARHLTGVYGGNTKAAVIRFQTERMTGKTANGIADMETQQALEAILNERINSDPDSWLVAE